MVNVRAVGRSIDSTCRLSAFILIRRLSMVDGQCASSLGGSNSQRGNNSRPTAPVYCPLLCVELAGGEWAARTLRGDLFLASGRPVEAAFLSAIVLLTVGDGYSATFNNSRYAFSLFVCLVFEIPFRSRRWLPLPFD